MNFYSIPSVCYLLCITTFVFGQFSPFSGQMLSSLLSSPLIDLPQLSQLFCIPKIFAKCPQMNSYFTSSPKNHLLNLDINWPKTKTEAADYCKNIKIFKKCFLKAAAKECLLPVDAVKQIDKLYIKPHFERYWKLACANEPAQIRFLNRVNCYQNEDVRAAMGEFITKMTTISQELITEEISNYQKVFCCLTSYGSNKVQQAIVESCGQEAAEDIEKMFLQKMGGNLLKEFGHKALCEGVQLGASYEDCSSVLKEKNSKNKSLDFKQKSKNSPVVERETVEELMYNLVDGQLPGNLTNLF